VYNRNGRHFEVDYVAALRRIQGGPISKPLSLIIIK